MSLNNLGLGFLFTAKDLSAGVMRDVKGHLTGIEGAASEAGKSMASSFKTFGVGAAIAGVGIAGLAMLGPALEEATEFSKAIALVATEADAALFPQEKMREVTEKLAVTFGQAPVKEAQALYKAVALGANDAAKSTAFLTGVNLLAVAGNADLELSANALGGALNAYHAPFSKASDYSDALFTAMKQGNTTVQDLAGSIGRVTASAANLNISIDEILGAVSVMTNQGVQASEAVSGLKEALANVVHPSAAAAAEAARLGVKFNQTELRAKGLQGFLKEITSSANFNANSMSKLFTSVEGANAILQVTSGKMGAFNSVMGEMAKKSGATKAGFDIMTDTLDFQNKRFDATKKVILGMIGNALEPMAKGVLKLTNTILEGFTKAPKPLVAFLTKLFAGASVVFTVVGAVIALKAALGLLAAGASAVGITLGGVLAALGPAIALIGLGALVVAGFRVAWEQNIGGIRDFFVEAWGKVKLVFEGLVQLFTDGGFSGSVREELNKAENSGVKQFAINVFAWIERIRNYFSSVGEGFSNHLQEVQPAIDGFLRALRQLSTLFQADAESADSAAAVFDDFGTAGANTGETLAQVFGVVVEVLTAMIDIVNGVAEGFQDFKPDVDVISGSFSFLYDQIVGLLVQLGLMDAGTATTGSGWRALGYVIGVVARGIVDVVGVVVAAIGGVVWMITKLVEGVKWLASRGGGGGLADVASKLDAADAHASATGPTLTGAAATTPLVNLGAPMSNPGVAASGAAQMASNPTLEELSAHLAAISKNTASTTPLQATLVVDGETLARVNSRAQRRDTDRSFTPAPIPE